MTAPDHRPYMLPTDLITAEDAARWLRERWIEAETRRSRAEWQERKVLEETYDDLRARLDRERRQACRRATFVNLPELARLQRKRKFAVERLWDYAVEDIDSLRRAHVDRALAFRAAARAR